MIIDIQYVQLSSIAFTPLQLAIRSAWSVSLETSSSSVSASSLFSVTSSDALVKTIKTSQSKYLFR